MSEQYAVANDRAGAKAGRPRHLNLRDLAPARAGMSEAGKTEMIAKLQVGRLLFNSTKRALGQRADHFAVLQRFEDADASGDAPE